MKNAIQNFQIPVTDFDRAHQFYSHVMDYQLEQMEFNGIRLGVFRFDSKEGVGGSIIQAEGLQPSSEGIMIYLHAGRDLQAFLNRVEEAGGKIFQPKTALGPRMGFYAIFHDSEGNRVGLYSSN